MSDPTPPENSEPATGPVLTPPPVQQTPPPTYTPEPPQTIYVQQSSRLNKVAAWVGIVAGTVFIVAVIFGTGFMVGKHAGGGPRDHHGGQEMLLRPGPPMFPMGPPGQFGRGPGFSGPFGPGGPMIELPRSPGGPGGSGGSDTTAPPRP